MARLSRRPLFRQRRSLTRRFAAGAALGAIVAIAVVGVAYLTLPWTGGLALRVILNHHGWGPARLHLTQFNLHGVTLKGVQLADGAISLDEAYATYTPADLWHGRIGDIAVKGLVATATLTERGVDIGAKPFAIPSSSSSPAMPFRHVEVADSKFVLVLPESRFETTVAANLSPTEGHWKGEVTADTAVRHDGGTQPVARFAWAGELSWPNLTEAKSTGRLDLEAESITVDKNTEFSGRGRLVFDTGDGQLALTTPERVVLNFSAFPWATETWGKTLAGGAALELGGSKGGATLVWREENGLTTGQADVDFTAVAGDASLRGGVHGKMTGKAGEIPDAVALDEIRVEAVHFPSAFGSISGQARISDVNGSLLTAEGAARLDATLTKPSFGPVTAATVSVTSTARFRIDGGTVAFAPQTLAVTAIELGVGSVAAIAPISLTLASTQGETPSLSIAFGATAVPVVTVGLAVTGHDLKVAAENLDPLTIDLPGLRVDGYLVPASGRYDISVQGSGMVSHPSADVRINTMTARFLPGTGAGESVLQLARLGGMPSRKPPAPGAIFKCGFHLENHVIDFSSDIESAKAQEVGHIKGQVNGTDGSARFDLDAPRLSFGEGVVAVADVFTGAFPIAEMSGTADIAVKAAWGPKASSSARLVLDNVALRVGNLTISGLATDFNLASLAPLRSPGPQRITATTMTAGLPFADLFLESAFAGDGTMTLSGGASVAGGKATFDQTSFALNDFQPALLTLPLSRIGLESLVAQADVDGLTATGSLSGTLPLRFIASGAQFENGMIKSDARGHVNYQPKSPPAALAGSGEIVLQALSNFEYDSIAASVNGDLLKDLTIGLAMKGRNPDLYGGYPISFKLNLGGPLGNILRQGISGYTFDSNAIPASAPNAGSDSNVSPR